MLLQPLLFALKGILQVKYEKKPIDNACFSTTAMLATSKLHISVAKWSN